MANIQLVNDGLEMINWAKYKLTQQTLQNEKDWHKIYFSLTEVISIKCNQ